MLQALVAIVQAVSGAGYHATADADGVGTDEIIRIILGEVKE